VSTDVLRIGPRSSLWVCLLDGEPLVAASAIFDNWS
jgi:hypothetical protein